MVIPGVAGQLLTLDGRSDIATCSKSMSISRAYGVGYRDGLTESRLERVVVIALYLESATTTDGFGLATRGATYLNQAKHGMEVASARDIQWDLIKNSRVIFLDIWEKSLCQTACIMISKDQV